VRYSTQKVLPVRLHLTRVVLALVLAMLITP
jgi:hypothetical protein